MAHSDGFGLAFQLKAPRQEGRTSKPLLSMNMSKKGPWAYTSVCHGMHDAIDELVMLIADASLAHTYVGS